MKTTKTTWAIAIIAVIGNISTAIYIKSAEFWPALLTGITLGFIALVIEWVLNATDSNDYEAEYLKRKGSAANKKKKRNRILHKVFAIAVPIVVFIAVCPDYITSKEMPVEIACAFILTQCLFHLTSKLKRTMQSA